ncbi:MAG: molybdate ABC transporter permease subunit [Desulfosarcina sp.]|nr:molybdate ABC transporter permease subunit [Desulfobacterales bacterium]
MEKKQFALFDIILTLLAGIFFSFIILVFLMLFTAVSAGQLWQQLSSPLVFASIRISLQTSLIVVCLTFFFGFPVAYLLSLKTFKGKEILDSLIDLPIVLPPLVSGLALLILFGGDGMIGKILGHWDIRIIFSQKGIICAQLFVSAPFFIKTVKESISTIPEEVIAASATLGASSFYTFRYLILPLSKNGILAGLAMTWTRAMGEFGATSMVAGCIPGQTETMTIGIYMNAMSGNLEAAVAVGIILLGFSFISLLILKIRFSRSYGYHY